MKKLFLFAAFLCVASLTTVSAQCTKSAKAANSSKACCAKTTAAMAKAVSNDASIEKRVCEKSGKVSYFKNTTCQASGKMTSTEVKFCSTANAFVNVSPSKAAMPVSAEGKKACTTSKAACAKKCTAAEKAACAKAGKTCAKTCNKSKSVNAPVKAEAKSQAKFTKGEN